MNTASKLKTVNLQLPAKTEDLAALELGTVVYLTGRVYTARKGVYKRAVEDGAGLPAAPEAMGFANFHCSPAATLNPDGSATVGAVTATPHFGSPSGSTAGSSSAGATSSSARAA